VLSGLAQEGHPLTGTWAGSWGPTPVQRAHLTVVMSWDGKKVTGIINPGPDAIPITNVSLDPANWIVRIEAERKDPSGKLFRIEAEGKIEDLASPHRKLAGTWIEGSVRGDLILTRD
jgi:hypothetical protein